MAFLKALRHLVDFRNFETAAMSRSIAGYDRPAENIESLGTLGSVIEVTIF